MRKTVQQIANAAARKAGSGRATRIEFGPAPTLDGMPYMIVRTYSAGVFVGYIKARDGKEATILQSKRIWYWDGAASLSELAQRGTSKPQNCKIPIPVDEQIVTEAIELLAVTATAKTTLDAVPIWTR